jgi:4-hydroxybenzoate polyprenyltransferase
MDSPADTSPRADRAQATPPAGLVSAAFKIVASVVAYRLRKLEMANLAAAGSIAVVLHLTWSEVALRCLFAFGLNVLVYLNNDYFDVADDLRAGGKDAVKSRFLADNMPAARAAQVVLLALLAVFALASPGAGLLVPLACGAGICIWYSAQLKRRPFADILSMMIWGVSMPLCGAPLRSVLGLALALQLGLFSGVFEVIQVLRDRHEDAQQHVRTTAVVLGVPRTVMLGRVLMFATSVYALAVMHPIAAVISMGALLVPFSADAVERYWTRVKLVYGVAWLVICGFVYFAGHSGGLRFAIDRTLQF